MSTDEPRVRLDRVSFRYPGAAHDAISDASLSVGANEFVGVVGPNGGGKTTLMRLILGLLEPRRGRIEVLGRKPATVRTRVGYVPQQASVDADVPATVTDIVLLGRLASGSWGPRFSSGDLTAASEALARTATSELAERPWATLSGGQRQRILIARALASDAELLLLDEPTSGVDLHSEQELLDLLHRLNEHLPVVMVSHDMALVSTHMDTALWINREVTAMPARELTMAAIERLFHGDESCHPLDAGDTT